MSTLQTIPAGRVGDHEVSLADLLYTLKISDRLQPFEAALRGELLHHAARREGIAVNDAELQECADAVRRSLGLLGAAETEAWLSSHDMTLDDFERYVERFAETRKLKEKVAADHVETWFEEHRAAYDGAVVERIVLTDAEQAQAVADSLRSGAAEFRTVARRASVDPETREAGGHLGFVRRSQLSPTVAAAVFAARPGEVVGPIEIGTYHHILRVEWTQKAELTPEVRAAVQDRVFADWVRDLEAREGIELTLPREVVAEA